MEFEEGFLRLAVEKGEEVERLRVDFWTREVAAVSWSGIIPLLCFHDASGVEVWFHGLEVIWGCM